MPFLLIAWQFAKSPLGLKVMGGIAILFACLAVYHHIRKSGYDAAIEQINEQNATARDTARSGGDRVNECYGRGASWVWDIGTGKCVRSEGNPGN